jgi:hypothetical protein
MVDAESLLDNLENARLAMSVAMEHTQENRDQFVKNGTGEQVRQAERSISKVRALAEQLEKCNQRQGLWTLLLIIISGKLISSVSTPDSGLNNCRNHPA